MNTIINQMLKNYEEKTLLDRQYVIKEIIQEMVLCGLSRGGFFKEAAFYGGTALRIFHGLDRFSEDLDFSLKVKDDEFDLTNYFPAIKKEIESFGLQVEISEKVKTVQSHIQSAFLKGNTREHSLLFYGEAMQSLHPYQKLRVKFEVDTNPPDFANFEYDYRLLPSPYEVLLYDMPSLFAGKIHAVLCRSWKHRVKGRDLYDYIFFLTGQTPLNLAHLKARLIQSGFLGEQEPFELVDLKNRLREKFDSIDYDQAKEDVIPFIRDQNSLHVWRADFFQKITQNLTVV